jgi:hypothetical protein
MPESHGLHKQIIRNGIATGRNNSNLAPIAASVAKGEWELLAGRIIGLN